jgi:hypothetical protein
MSAMNAIRRGEIAFDVAAIARGQDDIIELLRELIDAVRDLELAIRDDDQEEPPSDMEVWLDTQNPADHGGPDANGSWALRALGRYFGYPECCIDWFIGWNEENNRRDTERVYAWLAKHPGGNGPVPPPAPRDFPPMHPVSGHLMCPACVADPERAERLGAEARARRIAPPEEVWR